jgi:hypothetical protein
MTTVMSIVIGIANHTLLRNLSRSGIYSNLGRQQTLLRKEKRGII